MTAAYDAAIARMRDGGAVILDGGIGTELERRGAKMAEGAWCGLATLEYFDLLVDVHRAYLDAGAEVVTANTYASSRLMLGPIGHGDDVETANKRAVEAAMTARERAGRSDALIAGSMSHSAAMVSGLEVQQASVSTDEALGAFVEIAEILRAAGVDLILLEMVSRPLLAAPLFEASTGSGVPVWCGFSIRRDPDGTLRSWHEPEHPFDRLLEISKPHRFDAWGIMHSDARDVGPGLEALAAAAPDRLRMAYPDSGVFRAPHWDFETVMTPAELRRFSESWRDQGAQALGGCCGLNPEHIAAIADLKH